MTKWDKFGEFVSNALSGTRAAQIVHSESKGTSMAKKVKLPRGFQIHPSWIASAPAVGVEFSQKQRKWAATELMWGRSVAMIAKMEVDELAKIVIDKFTLSYDHATSLATELIAFADRLQKDLQAFKDGEIGVDQIEQFLNTLQAELIRKNERLSLNSEVVVEALAAEMSSEAYEVVGQDGYPINPLWVMVALEYHAG